ncbi:MAG: DUF1697 domain-containing protein [Ornithinibacter sp.]
MPSYVAFLRAVNVGGRFVKMAAVRTALEHAGFEDVRTHIQSGNVHVRSRRRSSASVAGEVSRVMGDLAGFDVPAIVRTCADLRSVLTEADGIPPLLEGERKRYIAFADGPVHSEPRALLDAWDRRGERVRVLGSELLADMTAGFHTTTSTTARLERITGLTMTWRDLEVVRTIDEEWSA